MLADREKWRNGQYSQRKFVTISGIPTSVVHKQLEPTAYKVLQHIGIDRSEERIESYHCNNKSSGSTILKFSRRKDCEKVMRLKIELRKLEPSDIDLTGGKKLFIIKSLYPIDKALWTNAKNYETKKEIFFSTVTGTVRVKLQHQGVYKTITHIDDLKDCFPHECFTLSLIILF